MNYLVYVVVAAIIYVSEAYLAIVVSDIGTVFGFVGTFAGTSISYFIPTILFCKAYSKFANQVFKSQEKKWYCISVINGVVGIFFFCLFLYANILSITSGKSAGH